MFDRAGVASVDTALTLMFVVAGFILMMSYAQRAIQGNFWQTTRDLGHQFDPRDPYTKRPDARKVSEGPKSPTTSQQQATAASAQSVGTEALIGPVVPERGPFANDPTMVLWSQPAQPALRGATQAAAASSPSTSTKKTTTVTIEETYEDAR